MDKLDVQIKGNVELRIYDETGNLKDVIESSNVVVDGMLDNIIESFIDTASNPSSGFQFIGLGRSDTPETVSDTQLGDEFEAGSFGSDYYADRISDYQGINYASNSYVVSGSITNESGDSVSINESGLFNESNPDSGQMGSRVALESTVQLDDGERIDFKWVWTVSSA